LLRRHFFLASAFAVLLIMALAAGWKLTLGKSAAPGGPAAAAQAQRSPGGGAGGRGGRGGPGGGFGGPALVTATVVQPKVFTDALEVLGVAKGRQSVTLTAATTQLVDKVRFTDGQSVRKGAVLIELKNTEQDAGLDQAQAQLVQSERAYKRYQQLAEQGWASKAQLDQYESAYNAALASVNAAKARQADRLIRAPFAGVVGLTDVTPGALVNPGAPIVTLDDLSTIRVDFQVPEQQLSMIREGQSIEAAVDALGGQKIRGRIARLDTRVDERTRSITARAEFANPGARLKPGMLIRVSLSRGQRTALAVPESAISTQGDSAFVFMIRAMGPRTVAEQKPVVTGLRQDDLVELLDGVQAGDRVVADGLNRLQSGQPIHVAGGPGGGHGGGAAGPRGAAGAAHEGRAAQPAGGGQPAA
jgi:membrane fusion protein (multidrug efflux system)